MKQFPSFPNYTEEMYKGNKPCRIETDSAGGEREYWTYEYGEAETVGDNIVHAKFCFERNRCIYIVGNSLRITKFLNNNIVVEYLVDSTGISLFYPNTHKKMSLEEAEKNLNKKIENCKIWDMIQKRAKELIFKSLEQCD